MADVSIRATAVTAAPMDYKVPGAQEIAPKSVSANMDGTSAAAGWYPCLQLLDPAGNVMFTAISPTQVAAGASADVSWFPHLTPPTATSGSVAGVILETFFYDTSTSSASSATVLTSGQPYTITVQGTYSAWNEVLDVGTPNADAMFPGSVVGRVSTEVGVDAETIFAWPHDHPHVAGHDPDFQLNLGSGFLHYEPQGGPYSTPQPNYLYRYSVTGQGSVLAVRSNDSHTDDYGKLQVTIQGFSGSSSGGGSGGSLVPPAAGNPNGDVLTLNAGLPAWEAAPGGGSVTSVSSTTTGIAVATPTTTPALTLATLDVIAADGPPAANWSNNSHKITSLTAGAAAGEAAIWDQTPAGLVTTKGDLIAGTGSHAAARVAVGADTTILTADSTQTAGIRWETLPSGPGTGSTVNYFTAGAGQTYTKPAGTNTVEVICIGAGGGGGGGGLNTASLSASGGGGGGGGAVARAVFRAADVGGTVTVNVGGGGGGGGSAANGSNGGSTNFGTLLFAGGGGGGGQGKQSAASVGGGGGSPIASAALNVGGTPTVNSATGCVGAQSSTAVANIAPGGTEWGGSSGGSNGAGNNAGGPGGSSIFAGPGGGGGGGAATATSAAGAAGGTVQSYATGGGGAGGAQGTNNGTGGTSFVGPYCGSAGGGGGANTSGNGGNGATGGIGAGGGGGGSGRAAGGSGQSGGDGRCIVISY